MEAHDTISFLRINIISNCLSGGSNPLLGDFLVVAGTVFLALSSVGQVRAEAVFFSWEF